VLHAYVHALATHAGEAFATPVVHPFPHEPQLATLVVSSTHVAPQSVGVLAGHPDTHTPPWHTGVPPLHALPHIPQFALFVCSLTHWPLHSENPLLHENPQVLEVQVTVAFATPVVQTLPHVLQLDVLDVVSTHVPPQSVGVGLLHPEIHVAVEPLVEQMGVPPEQVVPQAPQLDAVLSCTQAPLQRV
jgi:hypothetical protein